MQFYTNITDIHDSNNWWRVLTMDVWKKLLDLTEPEKKKRGLKIVLKQTLN